MDSVESCNNLEYWQYRKEEGEALLEIATLQLEQIDDSNQDNRHGKGREIQRKIQQIKATNRSSQRKIDRYMARQAVLSSGSEMSGASARAVFLELLMSVWEKTLRCGQPAFVLDLLDNYGSRGEGGQKQVWCVIEGMFKPRSSYKAAHIFPLQLGQRVMNYIFGPDAEGELNTARNGLFLPPEIEKALDKCQLVIVPNGHNSQDWKILVLDRSGLWGALATDRLKFSDLHEKVLQFHESRSKRPRARYFYFHFMMAIRNGHIGRHQKTQYTRPWFHSRHGYGKLLEDMYANVCSAH